MRAKTLLSSHTAYMHMQRTYRAALRLKSQCAVDGFLVGPHKREAGRAGGRARAKWIHTGGEQHNRRAVWVVVWVAVWCRGATRDEVFAWVRTSNQRQLERPADTEGRSCVTACQRLRLS
jgi:hypothetical protein